MPETKKKTDNENLNPRGKNVEIGIRALRVIKLWPLSVADELELTDVITKTLQAYFLRDEDQGDIDFAAFMVNVFKENLETILKLVCPDEDPKALLKDMDNFQLTEIAEIVYEANFGAVLKNVMSLLEKGAGLFLSRRPLPESASGTDTAPTTLTESRSETVASPAVK